MIRYAALISTLVVVLFSRSDNLVHLALVIALNCIAALGLALLWGYTGQLSLGQAAFYGLGAYGSAVMALRWHVSPWISAALAVLATSIVAWGLGRLVFRLRGHHLAMATLALGIIVNVGLVELRNLTGGPNGLMAIPPFRIFGIELTSAAAVYPLVWLCCLGAIAMAENLMRSPVGLAIRVVGENERVAASIGIDPAAIKHRIFALSAGLAALSGALYAHYLGYLSPGPFDVDYSIRLLLMVAVGGFMRIWGVLFGVVFITVSSEVLKPLGSYDVVFVGVLLVLTILFCPQGLLERLHSMRSRKPTALHPRATP
jgi:branched-chain amino acid transport system permease protein